MYVSMNKEKYGWIYSKVLINIGYLGGGKGKISSCLIYISLYCFTCYKYITFVT